MNIDIMNRIVERHFTLLCCMAMTALAIIAGVIFVCVGAIIGHDTLIEAGVWTTLVPTILLLIGVALDRAWNSL